VADDDDPGELGSSGEAPLAAHVVHAVAQDELPPVDQDGAAVAVDHGDPFVLWFPGEDAGQFTHR